VAARSKRGSAAAGSLALWVPIPLGAWLASLHFYTRLPHTAADIYAQRSVHVMITLTFTKEHQNIQRYNLQHSRICDYMNILTFDYCLTFRNAVYF